MVKWLTLSHFLMFCVGYAARSYERPARHDEQEQVDQVEIIRARAAALEATFKVHDRMLARLEVEAFELKRTCAQEGR